ncbi:MAG TPA: hypothetical protein VG099_03785 [Gemmataceae bacterium]|jgi:hypothetical protein|nr:hypothetical protein [Gemmataceae bacterium]
MLPTDQTRATIAKLLQGPTRLAPASAAESKRDRVALLRWRQNHKPKLSLWNDRDAAYIERPGRSGRMGTPNGRNGHCPAGVGEPAYLALEEEPTEIETWWDEVRSDFAARHAAGMLGSVETSDERRAA